MNIAEILVNMLDNAQLALYFFFFPALYFNLTPSS